ncbi:hypothetical protein QTJ16_001458 [Diplocarpon rosae]|uniref:Uncharacterized protein n=1 Tax=Diplocarpon rosae TaxID=946125 RepID=A0AAD9T638_9HELO|nr:hypothetical protein QTJ16_001458 [Diplocarpon rosae]PBP22322.1 hypothetical protein BUE80_DR006908 [Diplocarpon rosae]
MLSSLNVLALSFFSAVVAAAPAPVGSSAIDYWYWTAVDPKKSTTPGAITDFKVGAQAYEDFPAFYATCPIDVAPCSVQSPETSVDVQANLSWQDDFVYVIQVQVVIETQNPDAIKWVAMVTAKKQEAEETFSIQPTGILATPPSIPTPAPTGF